MAFYPGGDKLNLPTIAWDVAPSPDLNESWIIVDWTPGIKLQWNLNKNTTSLVQENGFENGHFVFASLCI